MEISMSEMPIIQSRSHYKETTRIVFVRSTSILKFKTTLTPFFYHRVPHMLKWYTFIKNTFRFTHISFNLCFPFVLKNWFILKNTFIFKTLLRFKITVYNILKSRTRTRMLWIYIFSESPIV